MNSPVISVATFLKMTKNHSMLTEAYIEALLVDEELADQVWEAWDKGEIGEVNTWWAWLWVVGTNISAVAYSCPVRFFRQTN